MKVFVYGALQKGQPHSKLFNNTKEGHYEFLGMGVTTEKYPLVIASPFNIPFMLPVEGNGNRIKGEVYDVNDVMLAALDKLEGRPNFYRRQLISVATVNGSIVDCGCYFLINFRRDLLELPFHESYHYLRFPDLPFSVPSVRDGVNEEEAKQRFLATVINI
ncbi:putative gamma-glutamylcyclotransferase CG2811 [Argopecten irradians]|uniref:putative gamma-glutamylcyclotransferase CG2811 n=1 Tax=Argopecten irradians TaxID=31199 RepID=UPI00371186B1